MIAELKRGKWNSIILTPELEDFLYTRYIKDGVSILNIGKEIGTSDKTVRRLMIESGIDIKDNSECRRRFAVDEGIFEKIDSHEKAYWLGFIYADGSVSEDTNNISIQLKSDDKYHLEKLRKFFKTDREVQDVLVNRKYNHARFTVTNKKIRKDIVNLGCTPAKSLTLKFPNEDIVPKEFINSFILGYYDGDGSLSVYKEQKKNSFRARLQFTGTYEFLEGMQKALGIKRPMKKEHRCVNNTYQLRIGKNQGVEILDALYKDSPVFLKRKYDKYMLAKDSIIRRYSPIY